jgi:DNA-binding GntR family transcriptional regulator
VSALSSNGGAGVEHGRRRQWIVDAIVRDLFSGRLGPGHRLVTRELAERFDVSHTPIREALMVLAGSGIVTLEPNRGAIACGLTARAIVEISQVRRALECEAVRSACGKVSPPALDDLEAELLRQADGDGVTMAMVIETDNRLHDTVAAASGNAFLAGEIARMQGLFRVFRDVSWEAEEETGVRFRVREEAVVHLEIVRALQAGRRDAAVRAMGRHIDAGARYWSRALAAAPRGHRTGRVGTGC